MNKVLFFFIFLGASFFTVPLVSAQVFLEFVWTLEDVKYEGLLYVPRDKTPTMTVRVLDSEGNLTALILEHVDLEKRENGAYTLVCSSPKVIQGPEDFKYTPESFTAQDDAPGKVSNGKAESSYEINLVNSGNIEAVVKKYLKDE